MTDVTRPATKHEIETLAEKVFVALAADPFETDDMVRRAFELAGAFVSARTARRGYER